MKEYEKIYLHDSKKTKDKYNHQIIGHKHINNGVHLVCATSLGPRVTSGEAASLSVAKYDDVCGIFFVITRMNTFNQSGMSLHEKFSGTLTYMDRFPQPKWHVSPREVFPIRTLTQMGIPST